jgi:hypothetical protein
MENDLNTFNLSGIEYSTKFSIGDKVKNNVGDIMIIDCVDNFLTIALGKVHWQVSSELYLLGKRKVNTIDPVMDCEIEHYNNY